MPLDPMIANPKPLELPDPMESMGRVLNNALIIDKLSTARQEREDNALLGEAYKVSGGNKNRLYQEIINKGQGRQVPALMKQFAEVEDKQAGAAKTKADTLKSKLESFRTVLAPYVNNPKVTAQDMYGVMSAAFNDPDIGDWYAQMNITPQVMKQGIDQAAQQGQLSTMARALGMGAEPALKRHYVQVDQGDKKTIVGMNEYGSPNATSAGTWMVGNDPNARGTNVTVNMPGQKAVNKFDEVVGEGLANEYLAMRDAANNAEGRIAEIRDIRKLINSGAARTGTGAEFFTNVDSIAKAIGLNVDDDKLVASQQVRTFIAKNMLENIATLRNEGVKLGAVTEKEFDQLMKSAPKMTDDARTIDAWLARAEALNQKYVVKFNQRLQTLTRSGARTRPGQDALSVDGYDVPATTDAPGAPGPGRVPPPPRVPGSLPPSAAVDFLRKNPSTAADFDRKYGAGASAQVLGGSPNGGRPFR